MRGVEARGLLLVGVGILIGLGVWIDGRSVEPPPPPPKVRLAVLIVVDQLRGDLPQRWQHLLGDRGFRRLAREGVWFQNCHYPYASTYTAAGHASIATGCSPRTHGIVGNEWYDRDAGKEVNASRALAYRNLPFSGDPKNPKEVKNLTGSGTPQWLLAPTVADALKKATQRKGKVVALSVKDRSAVLPGGERPDACYWADAVSGLVVTSTYYRGRPHAWVEEFNRTRPSERWLGKQWDVLRDDLIYDLHTGSADDVEGEGKGIGQGRTFPHPFPTQRGEKYFESVACSPFGNQLLLELALKAIEAEQLGQDDIPDLLTLSFSSNDLIGHSWGPDSHEVLDATLRTDRDLQRLLQFLDVKVGKGSYAVVLSADHGVCPLPEKIRGAGTTAGRVDPKRFTQRADQHLQTFGASKAPIIDSLRLSDFYLSPTWLKARGLKHEDMEMELKRWACEQPEVLTAYTRTELLRGIKEDDALGQKVRRSFHPERNGDVLMVLRPYHFFWDPLKGGTTHGSPHDYDRHVPLMVLGPGVRTGISQEAVTPQAGAPILAHFLGIDPPARAEIGVPQTLFESR